MTDIPYLTPLAASLPATVPFVGPEAQERAMGRTFKARLGANENVFGPSPMAIKAMRDAAAEVWMYGDPESHDLRHALASHHRVAPDEIIVGAGIDGLLNSLVRLTVTNGVSVVTSAGAYPTFNYHVAGYGGTLHTVPFVDDHEDPVGLIKKARDEKARLIYIANPDNPMGTWHDADTIMRMIDDLPDGCLLILDEAYVEFAPDGTAPTIDTSDTRVLRFRTFSKAYGLAGARIGYAIGNSALVAAFHRVRNHFGVSRISQAGALAALQDQAWLQNIQDRVSHAREELSHIAAENGLSALPSATNFVTIDCGRDGIFAKSVLSHLVDDGIFVRMPFVSPGNRCIRVSCGTESDLAMLRAALPIALERAKSG